MNKAEEKEPTSLAHKLVRLAVDFPCAGESGQFAAELPEKISKKSLELVVNQIEFRRKCMNQGFDNLLELIRMHWNTVHGDDGEAAEREASE